MGFCRGFWSRLRARARHLATRFRTQTDFSGHAPTIAPWRMRRHYQRRWLDFLGIERSVLTTRLTRWHSTQPGLAGGGTLRHGGMNIMGVTLYVQWIFLGFFVVFVPILTSYFFHADYNTQHVWRGNEMHWHRIDLKLFKVEWIEINSDTDWINRLETLFCINV